MNKILFFAVLAILNVTCRAQETHTGRKGSKLFPGHFDIVLTIEQDSVRYELFNHWYARSYSELRQVRLPLNGTASLRVEIHHGKVKLVDPEYGIAKRIKHSKLCATPRTMRNVSFAYKVAQSSRNIHIHHYDLYKSADLELAEHEFQQKVAARFEELNVGF